MKKIFVDIYLAYNLGDDLFLDILSNNFPGAEFTINYVGTNYDKFIERYNNVKRRKYDFKDKILQKLHIKNTLTDYKSIAENYDAIVFIGGSIFREEEYHNTLYKERTTMINEFKKLNKGIFIIGSNFGPCKTDGFIQDYKEFFEKCTDVCFRDTYSYNLYKGLDNVRINPDVVFQLDLSKYKKDIKKNIVGFSIIDVNHKQGLEKYEDEYINSTIKSINLIINMGYEVCLMSFCDSEGDSEVIKSILSKLDTNIKNKVSIYEYKGDLEESFNIISEFSLFIAARFHANIIAQLLDVSILPVIYSDKTSNMLEDIGLSSIMVRMNELEKLYDENIIRKSFSNKKDLDYIRVKSRLQFQKLSEFINK